MNRADDMDGRLTAAAILSAQREVEHRRPHDLFMASARHAADQAAYTLAYNGTPYRVTVATKYAIAAELLRARARRSLKWADR